MIVFAQRVDFHSGDRPYLYDIEQQECRNLDNVLPDRMQILHSRTSLEEVVNIDATQITMNSYLMSQGFQGAKY